MLLASVPAEEQSRAEEVLDSLKLRLEKLVVAITTRVRVAPSPGQGSLVYASSRSLIRRAGYVALRRGG